MNTLEQSQAKSHGSLVQLSTGPPSSAVSGYPEGTVPPDDHWGDYDSDDDDEEEGAWGCNVPLLP